jgi:hypothetical protein
MMRSKRALPPGIASGPRLETKLNDADYVG